MLSSIRKKAIYLLALVALFACVFTACSGQDKGTSSGQTNGKTSGPATSGKAVYPSFEESGNILDALWDLPIRLDGKDYRMPIAVSDLFADGWELPEGADEREISYSKGLLTDMMKNEAVCELRFENLSKKDAALKAKDCHVIYLSWEQTDNAELLDIRFPKDISLSSSVSDIKAAYGEPTASYQRDAYDESKGMAYKYGGIIQYLTFYAQGEKLSGFSLQVTHVEDFSRIDGKDLDTKDMNYEAPGAADNDLGKGILTVDGKLLRLPCPVAELINDGWIVCPARDSFEAGEGSSDVLAYKGHKALTLFVRNYSDKTVAFENTSIKSITTISSEPELLIFPDGVKLGDTIKDFDDSPYYTDNYLYKLSRDDSGKVKWLEVTYTGDR